MGTYNIDLVEYERFYQIKVYAEPISGEKKQHEDILVPRESPPGWGPVERVTYELSEEEKDRIKRHSCLSSVNRTKNIIYEYAHSNSWEWFVTFTFKRGTSLDVYDFDSVMRTMRYWLNRVRKVSADLKYLLIPEKHKDGAWHFHGLFANTDGLHFVDSGKRFHGRKSYNLFEYKKGFSVCEKVTDTGKISNYVLKYITKDLITDAGGKTRFIVSRGLNLAEHHKKLYSETEMQMYGNELMELFQNGQILYKKDFEIPCTNNKVVTYFVKKE